MQLKIKDETRPGKTHEKTFDAIDVVTFGVINGPVIDTLNRFMLFNFKYSKNGYLLNCMHKQQDFFGCLAEILGCLGLREAANLEI